MFFNVRWTERWCSQNQSVLCKVLYEGAATER